MMTRLGEYAGVFETLSSRIDCCMTKHSKLLSAQCKHTLSTPRERYSQSTISRRTGKNWPMHGVCSRCRGCRRTGANPWTYPASIGVRTSTRTSEKNSFAWKIERRELRQANLEELGVGRVWHGLASGREWKSERCNGRRDRPEGSSRGSRI